MRRKFGRSELPPDYQLPHPFSLRCRRTLQSDKLTPFELQVTDSMKLLHKTLRSWSYANVVQHKLYTPLLQ
jgi:hypothetical protein